MIGKSVIVCLAMCTCRLATAAEPVGTHNPNVPELATLERMAGTWQASLPNSEDSIQSTRVWVLEGRFLKHEFAVSNGALRGTIYRGYDLKNSRYTLTFLDSQGNVSLLSGQWDDEQKTFRFEAVDNSCPVRRYESSFLNDSTERWTIQFQNEQLVEISGEAKKSH